MLNLDPLRKFPLFSDMDNAEIAGIRAVMQSNFYAPGQTILREGDESDHFHVITEGIVDFLISDANGNELIVDEISEGGFFGELSMISGEKRAVHARAQEKVTTLSLDKVQFHDFLMKHPHAAIDIITVLGRQLYKTETLLRKSVSKNVNEVLDDKLTLGQKIADSFATLMGSWRFIIVQSIILVFWVTLNVIAWIEHWDPYPFILLNLALSFQAAYAAPIIMMSQNRQAYKDRLSAEIDHEVNVKAEIKTSLIMSRLDDIERSMHYLHDEHTKLMQASLGKGTG